MIRDYLFKDMKTGREFFVETDSKEEAIKFAKEFFEKPILRDIFNPEEADILGYDTY